MVGFIYILSAVAFVMCVLLLMYLYKHLYLRRTSYVIQKDVQKEVELPPLSKNMEFKEEEIQNE